MEDCRLIVDQPAHGAWNMAVDEALLADATDNGVATLRLYQWSDPTLSLGYFQRYDDRQRHAASRDAAVVRRQSGGGAILHDRELTYSISLPAGHPLARQAEHLYTAVHEAIIATLAPQVAAAAPGWRLELRCDESEQATNYEPFLCFLRRARGDVLAVAATTDGSGTTAWKILGSAQRRRRGAILQHGSLVLEKSPSAPEIVGLGDLTGVRLKASELAAVLPAKLGATLNLPLQESILPDDLRPLVAEIATRKYAAPGWTKRR